MSTVVFSEISTDKDIDFNDSAAFSGSIESVARCGVHTVTHTPTSDSGAILTGTMRKTAIALSSVDMTGTSHGIAGFDYLLISGDGDSAQQFVHESKFKSSNTGTISNLAFYKPAIDSIDGAVTNLKMIDCEMDLSGISGTITNAYCIYSPDTDKQALIKGGIVTDSVICAGDVTLDLSYSGKALYFLTGAAQTVTVPATLPAGFWCEIIQGDANQITVVGSGGLTVIGALGTKTNTTAAVITVRVINAFAAYIGGNAGT